MDEISLKEAYNEFTQERLFKAVCDENLSSESDYDEAQITADKNQFGCWRNTVELAQDLLQKYQDMWQSKVDSIDSTLGYYVAVDYSSMLQDDLYTGYFDLVECENGKIVLHMTPEGAERSHLTNND